MIVQPTPPAASAPVRAASSCVPTKVVLLEERLSENFAQVAGWPQALSAKLYDDCSNTLTGGSVVASFNNGDIPLRLNNETGTNVYSETWVPGAAMPSLRVTLRGTFGALAPATLIIGGGVNPNDALPPSITRRGIVHHSNGVEGSPLAPGVIVDVYGEHLATTAHKGGVPLPLEDQGTQLLVNGIQAALYYVSGEVVVAQLPIELPPQRQYSLAVIVNGAISVPVTVDVVPVQPGIFTYVDGAVIAQHADYTLVTPQSPARPGEVLLMYLAGMGKTDPLVPAGQATPLALVPAAVQPTVTVDGQNSVVLYGGLTPTAVGLYQINFSVPSGARSGDLDVAVKQGGVTSNVGKGPVQR
jgi:uncharacterized protein (TIGR03437 family)